VTILGVLTDHECVLSTDPCPWSLLYFYSCDSLNFALRVVDLATGGSRGGLILHSGRAKPSIVDVTYPVG